MAARAGMATLILKVRQLADAGTADTTTHGVTYWTDDQLEAQLDMYRTVYRRVALVGLKTTVGTTITYTTYPLPSVWDWIEQDDTDSGWSLLDVGGTAAPSHTVNYDAGIIEFDADTGGTTYYLDARTYDLYRTVGNVWDAKAGFVASQVEWSSDNHRVASGKEYAHYKEQATRFYAKRLGVTIVSLNDEVTW